MKRSRAESPRQKNLNNTDSLGNEPLIISSYGDVFYAFLSEQHRIVQIPTIDYQRHIELVEYQLVVGCFEALPFSADN